MPNWAAATEWLRRERAAATVIGGLILVAVSVVVFSLRRPAPLSFPPSRTAVLIDSGTQTRRITVDAGDAASWRFVSLRHDSTLERPGRLDWDLALRRFHIATNGGPGFAGQGAAGIVDTVSQRVAWLQSSADTTKSGFGKWYNYSFTSHLLKPKPMTYAVRAADGTPYRVLIRSYYCPGPQPGCITLEYRPD